MSYTQHKIIKSLSKNNNLRYSSDNGSMEEYNIDEIL